MKGPSLLRLLSTLACTLAVSRLRGGTFRRTSRGNGAAQNPG